MFTRKHGRKHRVPIIALAALREQPADPVHQVSVDNYQVFPSALPNGLPRPERFLSAAVLTIGNQFRGTAQFVRGRRGLLLEMNPNIYDMTRKQPGTLTISFELSRRIYDAMLMAHAHQYGRSREGRC